MAVKQQKPEPLLREFIPYLKGKLLIISIFLAIAASIICGALLLWLSSHISTSHYFWIISGVIFTVTLIATLAITHFAVQPLHDLMSALIHATDEPTTTTPPHINAPRYQKHGFRKALEFIYAEQPAATAHPKKSESEALIEALNVIPTGVVVLDSNGTIIFANTAAPIKKTTGGKKQLTLLFASENSLTSWIEECKEKSVHAEHIWTRVPDKTADYEDQRLFDVVASYEKGIEHEVVLTCIDRTSSYKVGEEDLNFIAFAAHELRGPITVIRGYIDVLQEELADTIAPDQLELFRRLAVSANRLTGYINNILNTARFDRRHLKVHLSEEQPATIYELIKDDMELRARAQNRLLSVMIPPELPAIAADRASLSEVFANLIDNAIKYSNEGGAIEVTAEQKGDFVDIVVTDHGIGMPGNVVSNLFQKFYRSHRSRETVAGTGIGLYISKAIVESHGGTINVRSVEGEGSSFIVSIPTYASVADKIQQDNTNESLIKSRAGWIKNHAMYRG